MCGSEWAILSPRTAQRDSRFPDQWVEWRRRHQDGRRRFVAALFPLCQRSSDVSAAWRPDASPESRAFLCFYLNLKVSPLAFCRASCKYFPSNVDVKRHPAVSSADWLAAPTAAPGSCGCNLTARLHEDSVMRTTVFILSTRVSVTRTPVFPTRVYAVVFLKRALTRTAARHQ